MISLFLGNKCVLCEERGKDLDSVSGYGIYNREKRYFHRQCLRDITCDPEHFKHIQVDWAVSIVEKLEEDKKKAIYRKKQNKKKCKTLSNYCVDKSVV